MVIRKFEHDGEREVSERASERGGKEKARRGQRERKRAHKERSATMQEIEESSRADIKLSDLCLTNPFVEQRFLNYVTLF